MVHGKAVISVSVGSLVQNHWTSSVCVNWRFVEIHYFHHVQFQFLGIKFCFGSLVDCELLNVIRVDVGNLQESISLSTEESKVDKVCILKKTCPINAGLT